MSRLPIRLRVTAAFAVAMAVVLAALGWFLYVRLESHLRTELDTSLQVRADDLAALVREHGSLAPSGRGLIEPGEGRITVDGVPLTPDNRRNWQRSIAHVPQAIFLADASIARNIAFAERGSTRAPEEATILSPAIGPRRGDWQGAPARSKASSGRSSARSELHVPSGR